MKKKQITLAVLCACFVALLIIYFAVVAPMLDDSEESGNEEPVPVDGEGIYLNKICMYPQIKGDIQSIEITNEHGTIVFESVQKDGKTSLVIKGHESLAYDGTMFAYLKSYTTTPSTIDTTPLRDLTDEQMREYGLTDDTCLASYVIKYKDENNQIKEYSARIGSKTYSSTTSYYACVEGRNTAYRLQSGVEKSLLVSLEDYVTPTVFATDYTQVEIGLNVTDFLICSITGNTNANPIVSVEQDKIGTGSNSVGVTFNVKCKSGMTLGDTEKISSVFSTLFTTFSGDKTVSVNPSDEDIKKYGLSSEDEKYLISAKLTGDKDVLFVISKPIDGYFYTISNVYEEKVIIGISESTLSFLKEENLKLMYWAATNNVEAGFYQYLYEDKDAGYSGIKSIIIRTKEHNEKFLVSFKDVTNGRSDITVTTESGKYSFPDTYDSNGKRVDSQFRVFYIYLINTPMSVRRNTMTSEEIQNAKTEENFVFELIAETNDGKVLKYSYYRVSPGSQYILMETSEGSITEDGTVIYQPGVVLFDTAQVQFNSLLSAYETLLKGEKLDPYNDLY